MNNTFILSQKTIPNIQSFSDLIKSQVSVFDGFNVEYDEVTNIPIFTVVLTVDVTQDLINQIEAIVPPTSDPMAVYQNIIKNAMVFGQALVVQFAAENVSMGITQDNMTTIVRNNLSGVTGALSTGSLYDAIAEIKAIPDTSKDAKYITNDRLLAFCNKIETYLQIPLSTSL